jgi:aldose 1-epimerase
MLRAPAGSVIHPDERGLPVNTVSVEGTEYDFRTARPIGETRLDHAFSDLSRDAGGLALVELSDARGDECVCLWLDRSYPYLMLFSGDTLPEADRRSLAVEPMTCPPNALRTGTSLVHLQPGGAFTSVWGIIPSPAALRSQEAP